MLTGWRTHWVADSKAAHGQVVKKSRLQGLRAVDDSTVLNTEICICEHFSAYQQALVKEVEISRGGVYATPDVK